MSDSDDRFFGLNHDTNLKILNSINNFVNVYLMK